MEEKALEVLEQYDLEVLRTRKGRGVYFVETTNGLHILKEYRGSEGKMEKLWQLEKSVEGVEFFETDLPVRSKEGSFLVKDSDETVYLLKSWQEGRECDPRNENDICRAMEGLAIFHSASKGAWEFLNQEERKKYEGANLEEELQKRTRELKKVQMFIRKKQKKNDFEICYQEIVPGFLKQAEGIVERLSESGYGKIRQKAIEQRWVCHGEYHQHNVYFGRSKLILTNFEHARLDLPCMDISLFLRKVMEKQRWVPELGKRFLNAYEIVRPLEEQERFVLALCLSYPEKLWKIANHYYHTNKAWISEKDMEKMKTFVHQQKDRELFVKQVIM